MPIKRTTPNEATRAYLERRLKSYLNALTARLAYIGEAALTEACEKGSYKDDTGNLRNSTGYVIKVGNRITASQGFARGEGRAKAEQLASKSNFKIALVVTAGMNYATYVSARGYDVLDSAELIARQLAKELLTASTKKS